LGIESILGQLANIYPTLAKKILGERSDYYESICTCMSAEITSWLVSHFPELKTKVRDMHGKYTGEGSEYSGTKERTFHCWVEIEVLDGKIIIDGAYAQFFPHEIPKEIRDRIRLAIFFPNDTRQEWYKP